MSDLEPRLRQALARVEPPAGFTEGVLARVRTAKPGSSPRRWLPLALAASLALAAGLPFARRELDRRQGERAKAQLIQALDITQEKLLVTEQRVAALNQRIIR